MQSPNGSRRRPAGTTRGALHHPIDFVYALARRGGLLEVTRLMLGPAPRPPLAPPVSDRYQYSLPTKDQLQRLLNSERCPAEIGSPSALASNCRHVIVASFEDQVVGFTWVAREHVNAAENFSRTPKLGTAIKLPETTAFIFNAWVAPQHRGQSLLASMIVAAASSQLSDIQQWVTTMDWTNLASTAAFKKLGLSEIGVIARVAVGNRQWIHAPSAARARGILCSTA